MASRDINNQIPESAQERRRRLNRESYQRRRQNLINARMEEIEINNQRQINTERLRESERRVKRRRNETDEETQVRRLRDSERHAERRRNETEEETQMRRMQESERQTERRMNETNEEAQTRRLRNAESAARGRMNLNTDINERQRINARRMNQSYYKCAYISENYFTNISTHNLGTMDKVCNILHCKASHYCSEKGHMLHACCNNGKIVPRALGEYPDDLKKLLTGTDALSKNFREFIRQYNSANAFASFGAQIETVPGFGPYCLKIYGEVYHRTGRGLRNDQNPSYAQLYFLDSDAAVEKRMMHKANIHCLRQIMIVIDNVLRNVNPFVHSYKKLKEVAEEEESRAAAQGRQMRHIELRFMKTATDDQRRYNAPTTTNEVAVIYVADHEGNLPADVDLAIHPRDSEGLIQIKMTSMNLDPMVFPLLFPMGEFGWSPGNEHHPEHQTASRNKITSMQFYSSMISVRRDVFNPIHHAGKLFMQYLIHGYIVTEWCRIQYIRNNQSSLRADSYRGLQDYIRNASNEAGVRPGNIVILPPSFVGGPRYMNKMYHDSMAMTRSFGGADVFITFTCNPNWIELKVELKAYQTASDRPDLIAKIFQLKVEEFIRDMTEKNIMGRVIAYVYVIEEQKRGLPHLHGLFTFSQEDKIRTAEDIDNIISAEIPEDPALRAIILKNNIHGPCGSICMEDGKCKKRFPKKFRTETNGNVSGYPEYRRRDNSEDMHIVRGELTDNRFVVPYNPYLSKKYNAHINVELCASVTSIKYIHKYISKGHDCARIGVSGELHYDEVSQFLNCRYISAPEAAWRILGNPIHAQSHVVELLPVHLPDGQSVFFREGEEEEALRINATRDTKLTAWFTLNREGEHPESLNIKYQDIPKHFIFRNKKWVKRQRGGGKVIGRISSISPRQIELYHLRLLLLQVTGAKSFEDLRTVDGILQNTFRDAARELHLIDDNSEWHRCMEEATTYMMPRVLRDLFVTILIHCNPADPLQLWNDFKTSMSEDFVRSGSSPEMAANQTLMYIQDSLLLENSSCSLQGLPEPLIDDTFNINIDIDSCAEDSIGREMAQQLNPEQLCIFNTIMESIFLTDRIGNNCFFIDGPGGTGKTFLYKTLIHSLKSKGKKILSVAWTGIAAILLPDGITCHTAFNLPFNLTSESSCNLNAKNRNFLQEVDVIIWDEAPMAPVVALNLIERTLRDIMNNNIPFGNKIIVMGGDFRQILPVYPRASRGQLVAMSIKSSVHWSCFKKMHLTTNVRAIGDTSSFSQWLLDLGDGRLPPVDGKYETSVFIPNGNVCNTLIDTIFGLNHTISDVPEIKNRAILCPKNENARIINNDILNRLNGQIKTFYSIDTVINDRGEFDEIQQVNYPVEYLNSVNPNGFPPHALNLKIGAIIVLLRNISIKKGLCNGTRMVVLNIKDNLIQIKIITGEKKDTIHFLPRISVNNISDVTVPFNFSRKQFPVKLAYAMTINKSQGQTFDKVGLYLPEPVFTHGQLYVGCSRVRSRDCLYVQITNGIKQGTIQDGIYTDNIVYKEIFD